MPRKTFTGAIVVVLVLVAGGIARADEIVQFTNGAEMTVQSHVVAKDMVKLDLGGNNFISFPITMVSKIVSAGQDVFRNPVYFPSNQAVAGVATAGTPSFGSPMAGQRQPVPGQAGMRLGEAADGYPTNDNYGTAAATVRQNPHDDMAVAERPRLDPLRPLPLGGVATIDPPGARLPQGVKSTQRMQPRGFAPPPSSQNAPAPAPPTDGGTNGAQDGAPQGGDGGAEQPPQEPPPNP